MKALSWRPFRKPEPSQHNLDRSYVLRADGEEIVLFDPDEQVFLRCDRFHRWFTSRVPISSLYKLK